MIANYFTKFSPELAKLPTQLRNNINELVFCQRQDKLSLVVGTYDFNTFSKIAKRVPVEVNPKSKRYGVDLESIYTNSLRIYWADGKDDSISLYGAYVGFDNTISHKKIYRRVEGGLSIERTIHGEPSENKEGEVSCDISEWSGPKEILELALNLDINIICLKKTHTDQTYLRLIGKK